MAQNERRISGFLKEYEELTKKYKVDFVAIPQFVPSQNGEFHLMVRMEPIDLEEREKQKEMAKFVQ